MSELKAVMPRFTLAVAIATIVAVSGCSTANLRGDSEARLSKANIQPCLLTESGSSNIRDQKNYRIEPGDVLALDFYLSPEFDEEVTVRPDGKITVRLAGDLTARGKTPVELARELDRAYSSELRSPDAVVHVKASPSRVIYVDGQVAHPGAFSLQPQMSAMQAVAQAGGVTEEADTSDAVLIRRNLCGSPAGTIFDLASAHTGSDPTQDLRMMPGDVIYVPRSKIANLNLFVKQYVRNLLPIPPYLTFPL